MNNSTRQSLRTAVVVLLAAMTFTQSMAQARAEYFIDEDPGLGNAIPATLPSDGTLLFEVPTTGLSPGNHVLGFRAYNTTHVDGGPATLHYGPTVMSYFAVMKEQLPQDILYAEYFWGDDPGYGKGIAIPLTAGQQVDLDNLISTEGMAPGEYTLGFRTRGTTGWGPTVVRNVAVLEEKPAQDILYAEYFWDDDPGYGKGIALELTPGQAFDFDQLKLSTYKLDPGAHTIGFRARGTTGWGPTVINNVEVMEYNDAQEIVYAEYFWDEDPGFGQGTPLQMTRDQMLHFDHLSLGTEGLDPGDHVLAFRTRGTTGWGPTVARIVLVKPDRVPQQVTYAEYFLDDDPGYGQATPIALTPGKELTISDIELPTDQDYHLFGFRTLATTGWSPTMLISVDADIYGDSIHAIRVPETTLPIHMANRSTIGQIALTLTLPEGVNIATKNGKLQAVGTDRLEGFTVSAISIGNNAYRITATPAAGHTVAIGEGTVINVTLQIDKSVEHGYYDLPMTSISVCNEYGMSLTRRDTLSVLHVENRLLGDVNDDGYVTVSDPVCLVSWLLGRNPPVFIEEVADFNQDGVITTSDAVAIIRYLLSSAPTPDTPAQDVRRHLTVSAGGADRLDIRLDDAGAYTAFTMDVTLPEGMTLLDASLHALRNSGHDIACHHLGGRQYRIIGFSTSLDTFDGDAPLLTLLTAGTPTGQLRIGNIRFVDPDATERTLAPYAGSATGIESVTTATDDGPAYRIDGTRTGKVRRGVNILHGKKTANK